MPKPPGFPGLRNAMKKNATRRAQCLAEMDTVVLWSRLLTLMKHRYPEAEPQPDRQNVHQGGKWRRGRSA